MPKESMDTAITIRLTPDEREKLEALAEFEHSSMGHVMRAAVREKYAQRFPNAPAKKVKRA
jgi:predicted transcriptional regulator